VWQEGVQIVKFITTKAIQNKAGENLIVALENLYRRFHQGEYIYAFDIKDSKITIVTETNGKKHKAPQENCFEGRIWIKDNSDGTALVMFPEEY
jgi:predicted nucleotide-binding protein (sugar kinase/HSP70/actin superfamily)